MATRESTDPAPRGRAAETPEAAYEGAIGRTRREPVHVTIPGGQIRAIQVYAAINLDTDPDLRAPALAGALHRFEGGEELAIPYVFHDPKAQKLAVVLPESLRHRELHERAHLMTALAEDTAHTVPAYAREAQVVIGVAGLAEYLAAEKVGAAPDGRARRELEQRESELTRRESELTRRESELARREVELAGREKEVRTNDEQMKSREERLHARAEDVTTREDEVRTQMEILEAQTRDQTLREQQIEDRFAQLAQREREAATREPPREVAASAPLPEVPASVVAADVVDEIDDLDEIEPVSTDATSDRPSGEMRARPATAQDVEEIVDEDDVEELDEADVVQEVTGVTTAPAERAVVQGPMDDDNTSIAQSGSLPRAAVAPPVGFLEDRTLEMAASCSDGVWLFARLDDGREQAFREGTDLLVQLAVVQGYPVVLLTLVEATGARPFVRRAALDPRRPEERRILETLRREFEATVALFGPDGRFERTVEVSAARRVNVALVLERVSRTALAAAQTDGATAMDRALAAPPPVRETGHPFESEDAPSASDAAEAANALSLLTAWSVPEKMDRALLALSIPKDVVDACTRRIIEDAVNFGIALTSELTTRALTVGVAPDASVLVARQIERFAATCKAGGGGLGATDIAENWQHLLEAAADAELAIEGEMHEMAWKAIRAAGGEASGAHALEAVDIAKVPSMGKLELSLLLDHPHVRQAAALELCERADAEMLDPLYKAVRKMPRAEVVRIVPRIVAFGEAAGDVLIDGLSARKTFVRQASSLGLGELKLRRAVVPLVHALTSEPSDVWREMARVLGAFGNSAFRQIVRAAKEPKGAEERLILTFAHLTNYGCDKLVDKLASDPDKVVAALAVEALTLRNDARQLDEELRGRRPFASDDGIKRFSHRFYQELAGQGPVEDLD